MVNDGRAVIAKMKIDFFGSQVTKFFCGACKMEITDPSDHTKFKALVSWLGGTMIYKCPHCKYRLTEVVTPLESPEFQNQKMESFTK